MSLLKNKIGVITGGSSGIGLATAKGARRLLVAVRGAADFPACGRASHPPP